MTTSLTVPDPVVQQGFAERRTTQLAAALDGNRYRLVESVINERRNIISIFNEDLATPATSFDRMNP